MMLRSSSPGSCCSSWFAALASAIAGLGTVEILIVAVVTAALAVVIARRRERRGATQG